MIQTLRVHRSNPALLIVLGLLIILLSSACAQSPTLTSDPGSNSVSVTASASTVPETATVRPTETPARESVLFYTPSGSDVDLVTELQERVGELSQKDNLDLQVVTQLSSSEIGSEVKLVVVVPPDPGVRALASAVPDVQFLAIGFPDLEPGSNLGVLGGQAENFDQQGFLAGYLAATVTPEWRVGVINSTGVSSEVAGEAFLNGAIFFCGLCRPVNPPYIEYPQIYNLPSGAGSAEQALAVDYMIANGVRTVYITPGVLTEDQVASLAEAGINLIGSEDPPAGVQENWIATVGVDWLSSLEEIWSRLLAGEGGITGDAQLVINDRNQDLFSIGRQRLVEELLGDLEAGYIDTGVNSFPGDAP